jgi:DNA-binding transcriptional LysR family regulator
MINIPTELLRTLIAVVDLRSFTKAAQQLGVTQPAVSAQLKRLQILLEGDILDKSAPGVSLTPMGELVVNYARRMLSINDQILELSAPRDQVQTIRIAVPGDFAAPYLPAVLAKFRRQWPQVRFSVKCGAFDAMLRDLRQGDLDILVGLTTSGPSHDARYHWIEEMAWVRGRTTSVDLNEPIPLISYGEICAFHRAALMALSQAGLDHDLVFVGSSISALSAAVSAGLGIMAYARSRITNDDMVIWDNGPLPPLNDLFSSIYLRDGGDQEALEQVAAALADVLKPRLTRGMARYELSSPLTAAAYLIG